VMTYNPQTGEGWDQAKATEFWAASMARSQPRWQLRGKPGAWVWEFWNFGPWHGWVTIEPDGFAWSTTSYDTGERLLHGKTTSLFEAYQSCERNAEVKRPAT